jgi:hypothetical protein
MNNPQLTPAEAELIQYARAGESDLTARTVARDALEAMWPQHTGSGSRSVRSVALLALGAGLAAKGPDALGWSIAASPQAYGLNLGLLVLPWSVAMFGLSQGWQSRAWMRAGAILFALLAFVNLFPFDKASSTAILTAAHVPVALWFVLGWVRAGAGWRDQARRLDFVRFTGEVLLYFALLAMAGGVLMGLTIAMFSNFTDSAEEIIGGWVLPLGAAGATVVAVWLADSSGRAMGRVALTVQRVFTPLFALAMTAFAVSAIPGGFFTTFQRDQLAVYDGLLVVVSALAMYAVAAQSASPTHPLHDRTLLAMVTAGVVVDALIVVAMVDRTMGMGLTPNRVAATGLNLVLLANLTGLMVRQWRRISSGDLEAPARWQAAYLPVLAGWATVVAVGLPLVFQGA